jgi:hypothetical protein
VTNQILICSNAKNISVQVKAIALCLCVFGLTLLKLKTKAFKGRNNSLKAKHWQLLVNPFHVGLHNVDGYVDYLRGD